MFYILNGILKRIQRFHTVTAIKYPGYQRFFLACTEELGRRPTRLILDIISARSFQCKRVSPAYSSILIAGVNQSVSLWLYFKGF